MAGGMDMTARSKMARGFLAGTRRPARLRVHELPGAASTPRLVELLAEEADPVALESTAEDARWGRCSIYACRPQSVLELRDDVLRERAGDGRALFETAVRRGNNSNLWDLLERAFTAVELVDSPGPRGYAPGWMGYLSYELGRCVERLPSRAVRDTALPDLHLGFYDAILLAGPGGRRWKLLELEFRGQGASAAGERLRELFERAATASGPLRATDPAGCSAAERPREPAEPNFTPEAYRAAVTGCVEHIARGDIFQVNLSQRFAVEDAPPPVPIYRALRRRNPSQYAAMMRFESAGAPCAVLSSSPELFLRVRGDRVLTRPIKGTRGRSADADEDARAARELLSSEKDNAELAMIIDLLRNDLGRICRYGSVRVLQRRCLESHPTVHHLVGTVYGRLCAGVSPARLLRASFPGGSITGAPKIRAMEIIDEYEPCARGVYTGSVGLCCVNGAAEWNIAIRTVVCEGSRAWVQAGGGIVADSDPELEYRETLHKARALLEAMAEARRTMEA